MFALFLLRAERPHPAWALDAQLRTGSGAMMPIEDRPLLVNLNGDADASLSDVPLEGVELNRGEVGKTLVLSGIGGSHFSPESRSEP
jgi:hypothetical protein